MPYRTSRLKRLTGRLHGGIPPASIDVHTLYTVRVPKGAPCPGRILETDRLWEVGMLMLPNPSSAPAPMRSRERVVGLLAITNRSVAPAPEDVARLRRTGHRTLPTRGCPSRRRTGRGA
ncbi:hypothetical protein ACFV2U_44155 [Streptomyces sp. NPDC059697]|uniref:hypothetical protein n=1 Tax=Streptomyces sp. NPDC059697 TaxID=3346912 RepID=UPI0036B589D1